MRILPCSHCRLPALATKAGILQTSAQCPDSILRYTCARCRRPSVLSSAQFSRLPEMTMVQLEAKSFDLPLPRPLDEDPPR